MKGDPTDLFDGPPWTDPPPPKHIRYAARPSLVAVAIGAGALALSTALPWYGTEPSGRLSLGFGFSPLSPALFPLSPGPGGTGWGYLILGLGVLTSITALAIGALTRGGTSKTVRELRIVAVLAMLLLVVTLLELIAQPPDGDGPPMGVDWGGMVGGVLSLIVFLSAVAAQCIGWRVKRSDR